MYQFMYTRELWLQAFFASLHHSAPADARRAADEALELLRDSTVGPSATAREMPWSGETVATALPPSVQHLWP